MSDPELRSDETVLLRTQGVYVKSIPFEGVLTNKRIILIDRAKNLLPQKEIPLVTIKDIEPSENAIRDQIITISVLARSGETRQMILTFSRQTGGNRIRERDEWVKTLKENTTSSFDQVVRKVIPGAGPAPKKPDRTPPPRLEVISSPVSQKVPAAAKTITKKEKESAPPIKKVIESRPEPTPLSIVVEEPEASVPSFGTYCSRCGNRVPDGSGFCNRCGSQIVVSGSKAAASPPVETVPRPAVQETATTEIKPIDEDVRTIPRFACSGVTVLPDVPLEFTQEQKDKTGIPTEQEPAASLEEAVPHSSDLSNHETDEKPEPVSTVSTPSPNSESIPPSGEPPAPKKPRGGFSFKFDKKVVISIIAVIIIVVVILGVFFLYPMISNNEGSTPDSSSALTAKPTIIKNSGTPVFPSETAVATVPTIIKNSKTPVFPSETSV